MFLIRPWFLIFIYSFSKQEGRFLGINVWFSWATFCTQLHNVTPWTSKNEWEWHEWGYTYLYKYNCWQWITDQPDLMVFSMQLIIPAPSLPDHIIPTCFHHGCQSWRILPSVMCKPSRPSGENVSPAVMGVSDLKDFSKNLQGSDSDVWSFWHRLSSGAVLTSRLSWGWSLFCCLNGGAWGWGRMIWHTPRIIISIWFFPLDVSAKKL